MTAGVRFIPIRPARAPAPAAVVDSHTHMVSRRRRPSVRSPQRQPFRAARDRARIRPRSIPACWRRYSLPVAAVRAGAVVPPGARRARAVVQCQPAAGRRAAGADRPTGQPGCRSGWPAHRDGWKSLQDRSIATDRLHLTSQPEHHDHRPAGPSPQKSFTNVRAPLWLTLQNTAETTQAHISGVSGDLSR